MLESKQSGAKTCDASIRIRLFASQVSRVFQAGTSFLPLLAPGWLASIPPYLRKLQCTSHPLLWTARRMEGFLPLLSDDIYWHEVAELLKEA